MYKDVFITKIFQDENIELLEHKITEFLQDTYIEYEIIKIEYKIIEIERARYEYRYSVLIILRRK